MSLIDWLGFGGSKPDPLEAEVASREGPKVAPCARTALPKRAAAGTTVRGRGGTGRRPSQQDAYGDQQHVPKSSQVPTVVADFGDMIEPTVEPVYIHIYELGPGFKEYFGVRAQSHNPYHSSIEVCAAEYSFGMNVSTGVAEIATTEPKRHPQHKYKLTVCCGYTAVPPSEVLAAVKKMDADWNNNTFSWSSKNCHHFTDALCGRLGTKGCPSWLKQDHIATFPVFLRVYNLGQTAITRWHNNITKSYGAYHTGVEVHGREWAFGVPGDDLSSAVGWCPPGECPEHDYREAIHMGQTSCSPKQVEAIIAEMRLEWKGETYDIFTRNCHKFSQAFCSRLGVAQTPSWINDLAEALAPVPDGRSNSKDPPVEAVDESRRRR